MKYKNSIIITYTEYRAEDESAAVSFIVALESGVFSEASCKIPFNDCAFTPEEIIPLRKKQNKSLCIE